MTNRTWSLKKMDKERFFCEGCGIEISSEESEQFNGFCEECYTEMEITDLDLNEDRIY